MTINTFCYIGKAGDLQWRNRSSRTAGNFKKKNEHAERKAYADAMKNTPEVVLILQDGFPCEECDKFFSDKNQCKKAVIFKITANNGLYSFDHGLPKGVALPVIIYYFEGVKKIVGLWSRGGDQDSPPEGFPPHADIEQKLN
jgi:hypothetical protein